MGISFFEKAQSTFEKIIANLDEEDRVTTFARKASSVVPETEGDEIDLWDNVRTSIVVRGFIL